jgi:TRAP-type transport system small permease protein
MVVVIFGALPLVSWRGEHVVFDSLDAYVPAWLHRIQQRLVHLICAVVFAFMAKLMVQRADRFSEYGDITVYLQLPLSPVAWMMAVFLLVTALVHLIFVFVRPPEPRYHGATGEGSGS